jgi:hypothetical protein
MVTTRKIAAGVRGARTGCGCAEDSEGTGSTLTCPRVSDDPVMKRWVHGGHGARLV